MLFCNFFPNKIGKIVKQWSIVHLYFLPFCIHLAIKAENSQDTTHLVNLIPPSAYESNKNTIPKSSFFVGERWSLIFDIGTHFKKFKNFPEKNFDFEKDSFIDKNGGRNFWGEHGFMISYGFYYNRQFGNSKWSFGSRIAWTLFLPDVRYYKDSATLTLGFVPWIGNLIRTNLEGAPGWLEMIIVPIVYFDINYQISENSRFGLGSVYIWGLSPSLTTKMSEKCELEFRTVIFLDKLVSDGDVGVHNYLFSVGLNYRPW